MVIPGPIAISLGHSWILQNFRSGSFIPYFEKNIRLNPIFFGWNENFEKISK